MAQVSPHGWLHGVETAEGGGVPQRAANIAADAQQGTLPTYQRALTLKRHYVRTSVADPDLFRIHMFLGLLDPNPCYGSRSFYHQAKIGGKTLIPTVL